MTVLEALKEAIRREWNNPKEWNRNYYRECVTISDKAATRSGPLVNEVAAVLLTSNRKRVRDELQWLERRGHVIRDDPKSRGTAHRYWPVGFSEVLRNELTQPKESTPCQE